jgi:hypothetical protein
MMDPFRAGGRRGRAMRVHGHKFKFESKATLFIHNLLDEPPTDPASRRFKRTGSS